jgi:hypothetical protein
MAYIPNATDATQPLGTVDASTAAAEFRALKAYVLGLALTAGMFSTVRQTVNDGVVNSLGDPAFLIAAAAGGAALDLKATGRPLVVNFAGGSTGTGVADRNSTLTGDTANVITGLPVNNTSYIYTNYVSAASMTWGQTLAPVQYGKFYPQSIGSILQFGGAAGSTVFLDDFGNTWAAQAGAKVQTNQFKFGSGGLGGAGASNVLNGTTDFVKNTTITSLGSGGWFMRGWVYATALPTAGQIIPLCSAVVAGGFGANVGIYNNAGTIKFFYSLSSNGTSRDIAVTAVGTTTPLVNTWYFVELTYDALAAVYRMYIGGVQEQSTASASKIAAFAQMTFGGGNENGTTLGITGYADKFEYGSYCQHPAGTTYTVPAAAPSIVAAGYAPDYFDIQGMKMYSVSAASATAGVAPTLTSKYRCYVSEVDMGAVTPTTIRNYAFNGKYTSADTTVPGLSTRTGFSSNLGTNLAKAEIFARNYTADRTYTPGMVIIPQTQAAATYISLASAIIEDRNTVSFITSSNANALDAVDRTTGGVGGLTSTAWKMFVTAQRSF